MSAARFWVTGARGLLGQAVVRALADCGIAHVASGREVDLGDPEAVTAFARAEPFSHVIHCAAFTQVDACEAHEAEALRINAGGAEHVARAAAARGAVAVHVSTDYVFDGAGARPYREDDPVAPINAYGRTKLAGEQRFVAAAAGIDHYVVRTSWLFGPGRASFVATMLRLFGERPEVRVVGDQTGRPTYAPDLAGVLVELALRRPARGIYHFANAGPTTWYELAEATRAEAIARGLPAGAALARISTAEYPTPARRPAWSVLATDKIEAALDLAPRPWRAALATYFEAIA